MDLWKKFSGASTSLFPGVAVNNEKCQMWYNAWTRQHSLNVTIPDIPRLPGEASQLFSASYTSQASMTFLQQHHEVHIDPGTLYLYAQLMLSSSCILQLPEEMWKKILMAAPPPTPANLVRVSVRWEVVRSRHQNFVKAP